MAILFQVSEDIVPLYEFKARAAQVLRRLRESNRAVVITQNGRPAAVLVSPEEFDRLQERERFLDAVDDGLRDSDAGRTIEDALLARELASDDEPETR